MGKIRSHKELRVYHAAVNAAMEVYELIHAFPSEERFSMTDQVHRSSRSVCGNIAEAWRKRRYAKHFQGKLSDAEAEAAETQVWLELAQRCGYIDAVTEERFSETYDIDPGGSDIRAL